MSTQIDEVLIQSDPVEFRALRKVKWHLLPFLFLLFVISYIDRSNIGFAALQMNKDLGISLASYGVLSGIFYLGYVPFQIPSNILLCRLGARVWLPFIVITWGLVILLTGWAKNIHQLYALRILLGVAESGLLPGCIFYMTNWFPEHLRGRSIALFMTAIPVSSVIGAPIATLIMDHIRWLGLAGWRWAFILEGLPAVVAGALGFLLLTDKPQKAKWLKDEEKIWLTNQLSLERLAKTDRKHYSKLQAFTNARIWRLSVIYFALASGQIGIVLWLPTIVKGLSARFTNTRVGLIVMIPYICATIAMLIWSRHSDKSGERKFHAAIGSLAAAVGLLVFAAFAGTLLKVIAMTITLVGIYCFYAPFWSLPSQFLIGDAAAVGIATVNSVGMIGGFVGPSAIGYLASLTGTLRVGLYFVCGMLILSFLLIVTMQLPPPPALGENGARRLC